MCAAINIYRKDDWVHYITADLNISWSMQITIDQWAGFIFSLKGGGIIASQ